MRIFMRNVKQKVFEVFSGKPVLAGLATTTADGNPWVRYVTIVMDENDMSIRFATFINARKVQQILRQPEVHLTCGATDNDAIPEAYLQIQGKASFLTEKTEREMIWNDELKKIFNGIDDPNFGVIKVEPYRIEIYLADTNTDETLVWEK